MTLASSSSITLQDFLKLPETKPAREYCNGEITQKPMPKGRHSRLQMKLTSVINEITEKDKIAYAFPESRCSFGTRSVVPDIAVFQWSRIPFTARGEVPDNFYQSPDWVIEILSPEQKPNRVIDNILYCLQDNCQWGWFIDPDDRRSVLVFSTAQKPQVLTDDRILPVLDTINLQLTVEQMFNWLTMNV